MANHFANRNPVEPQPDKPACSGPGLRLELGANAAGQKKPAGPRIVVNRAFDRAEDRWDGLPLVKQQRLGLAAQSRVGIGAESRGLGLTIEPDNASGVPAAGRGLASSTWPGDQQRGELREQLRESPVQ
jgi:hypothetical protein